MSRDEIECLSKRVETSVSAVEELAPCEDPKTVLRRDCG
jgi:hypothetical protein